jgi:hypothetical protein
MTSLDVPVQLKMLIEILCRAIAERHFLKFYYESKNRKAWRIIRPYMIWSTAKGNLSLAGAPIEELKKSLESRNSGQYLLSQLLKRF